MMDFITIPAVLTVIGFFVYKLFELFVCKKERLYMIENAKDWKNDGKDLPYLTRFGLNPSFSALKWGTFFLGIGLGLIVAYFICLNTMTLRQIAEWEYRKFVGVVYGGCTLLFGGLGLIISFIIEAKMKIAKKENDN